MQSLDCRLFTTAPARLGGVVKKEALSVVDKARYLAWSAWYGLLIRTSAQEEATSSFCGESHMDRQ